jgi:arylsulfatase A-like enzyme
MDARPDSGAYEGFQGKVGRVFATSEPWWPPRPKAPEGAPNVVVVLADDLGFSDIGCYGSEIPTPNIDAFAAEGLCYTNFHVAPLCSPTRAALMTGRNPHAAGVAYPTHVDPGFPAFASELPENQPSLAEVMRANGYSTFMLGKWHLSKEQDMSEAGNRASWPLQRGFDEFYGFLEALTNFHHPHRMYDGNSVVQVDEYPEDYYLTDDLTDRAERMIREVKTANPDKPFFMYFAHGAVHAPLHAKKTDIERYRGWYEKGWDALREERLARQLELGIVPPGTQLPPRNAEPGEDVPPWDSLTDKQKRLYARYMEVYAGMVDNIDQSVGRLRSVLEELGELENTVFLFTSDNGASREGKATGTTAYFRDGGSRTRDVTEAVIDEALDKIDEIGGPTTWPHYPRGWAMACNTPFRLYKISTFAGGHQVPMVLSWPKRIEAGGQVVRRQYSHISDVLPTLVDLLGLELPTQRNGLPAHPPTGASLRPSIEDPQSPTTHPEQYYECVGNRAFYRDGWEVVTFHQALTPFSEDRWQLFHTAEDPTQITDLADRFPDRVKELTAGWEDAAWDNQVFPLYEGNRLKYLLKPPGLEVFARPVRLTPGLPTVERWRASQLITGRSFRIVVDWSYRSGDEGIVLAHGGQEAGYVLYVDDGELHFQQNQHGTPVALPAVPLGASSQGVVVDVTAPGSGTWEVELLVDGQSGARAGGFVQLSGFLPFEGIDIGLDRRSPVSWDLYSRHGCFPFTGSLTAVTYEPGPVAPDAAQRLIDEARRVGLGLE